jgi:hypothetical protein
MPNALNGEVPKVGSMSTSIDVTRFAELFLSSQRLTRNGQAAHDAASRESALSGVEKAVVVRLCSLRSVRCSKSCRSVLFCCCSSTTCTSSCSLH